MEQKQKKLIKAYKNGEVLTNTSRGMKNIRAFQFRGNMYITNGVKRNKKYSFDDCCWETAKLGLASKIGLIITRKVKKAIDCKKSLKVNV